MGEQIVPTQIEPQPRSLESAKPIRLSAETTAADVVKAASDISEGELHSFVSRVLGDAVSDDRPTSDTETEAIKSWLHERLRGIRYKGVDIVTVDCDPVFEPELHNALTVLLQSKNVDGIAVEYFFPELVKHARGVPIVGRTLAKMLEESSVREKSLKGRPTYTKQYDRRLHFAKRLSDALALTDKPVSCFDIANKPRYVIMRDMSVFVESFIGERIGRTLDKILQGEFDTKGDLAKLGMSLPLYLRLWQMGMQALRKGMYDPEHVSTIEQYQFHLEDARRLIIAEGLLQHIDRLDTQDPSDRRPAYLVVYPKAHNLRIREYMKRITHGDRAWPLRVKDIAYRLVSDPILEFKERTYRFSDSQWTNVSERKIGRRV